MNLNEKQINQYLDMKEQNALNMFRTRLGITSKVPEPFKELIEQAFLIGYGYGGIEYENDLRRVQKDDPMQFYKWIEGTL